MGAGALFVAVFLACAVEAVEATTIVLAAGTARDWRSANTGMFAALVVLARDQELRRRMGAYGLEKARRYAWEEVAGKVVAVYNEARQLRARQEAVGSREVMNVHDAV